MILILAKSPRTSELLPPIVCQPVDFKDGGMYYSFFSQVDGIEYTSFLPNDCILAIKRDISLEAVHQALSSL